MKRTSLGNVAWLDSRIHRVGRETQTDPTIPSTVLGGDSLGKVEAGCAPVGILIRIGPRVEVIARLVSSTGTCGSSGSHGDGGTTLGTDVGVVESVDVIAFVSLLGNVGARDVAPFPLDETRHLRGSAIAGNDAVGLWLFRECCAPSAPIASSYIERAFKW